MLQIPAAVGLPHDQRLIALNNKLYATLKKAMI